MPEKPSDLTTVLSILHGLHGRPLPRLSHLLPPNRLDLSTIELEVLGHNRHDSVKARLDPLLGGVKAVVCLCLLGLCHGSHVR
jgi:hypothetical protein